MLRLDTELIKDRFAATSYSFYSEAEIKKLSVKQIYNIVAFDHLNNPMEHGLYDKALGVSPFDAIGKCVTCGLDHNFCPGHVGHIHLSAPVFNPFLIQQLYKLLKSKCMQCHRIRIHPRKIDIYVMCLKLIKSGDIIASSTVKSYFLNAAKAVKLITDEKKVHQLRQELDSKFIIEKGDSDQRMFIDSPQKSASARKLSSSQLEKEIGKKAGESDKKSKKDIKDSNQNELLHYFKGLEEKFNEDHQKVEEDIILMYEAICAGETFGENYEEVKSVHGTSIVQKYLKETIHEIWSQVITTVCPHCQYKNPSIRKDGYTKIFMKSVSEKYKNQQTQAERLQKANLDRRSSGGVRDDGFEIRTDASTTGNLHSRKESHTDTNKNDDDELSLDEMMDEEDAEEELKENEKNQGKQKFLTPLEIKDQIDRLWKHEKDLLDLIFGRYYQKKAGEPLVTDSMGPSMFFTSYILVPPNRFRPESKGSFGGGGGTSVDKSYLHSHSQMLTKILTYSLALSEANQKQTLQDQKKFQKEQEKHSATQEIVGLLPEQELPQSNNEVVQKWILLQDAVNTFMDSSMAQKTADKEQNGIRQLLERKEGMFRMRMMGKRVNFGGRSVISPDPYITTDQIGVPVFMAKKLTFAESVSLIRADHLRKLIINGHNKHPGANMIEDEETGIKTRLDVLSYNQRKGLAKMINVGRKIVYRHLQTGDVLLVNRQPTLHKPSIMAHVARILPKEQTIRMHYANCSTYNADFDGDEMNLHFPQSYQACSEAYKLMATHKQYIVPTSGKPIRGLIQDSIVSGVFLSSKDTFLPKDVYQQLVYVGLRELIEDGKLRSIFTLPPAVLKPEPLFTGKQVISTILKNIVNEEQNYKKNKLQGMNLDSKSKLSAKEWGPIGSQEGDVVIRDNELLQGTIDKAQYGASEFGMVHSFYEIYGSEKAGELLTSLARIFTCYLQMHGFTCGLDDLVLTPEFNKQRRMIIEESHKGGIEAAAEFSGLKNFKAKQFNYSNRVVFQNPYGPKDKDIQKFTDMAIPENPFKGKKTIQEDDPIRKMLADKMNSGEDTTKLDAEIDSVMKGKMNQATSQVLKICVPDGLVKRFPKNNISAMVLTGAKGGLVNMTQITCLLGQQELEGRRVPKMQNGKTLPCFLPYDPNPRSSGYVTDRFISGLRPQDFFFHCMAGREGLIDTAVKTSRSGYLQRCLIKQLESLIVNYDMTVRDNDGSIVQFHYGEDSIDVMNTKFLEKFNFLESNFTSLISSYNGNEIMGSVDIETAEQQKYQNKKLLKRKLKKVPGMDKNNLKMLDWDPVMSQLHPLKYYGSISEKMENSLSKYLKKESLGTMIKKQEEVGHFIKTKFKQIKPETFKKMYFLKYMKSLVHPGENVGTIAAQSVGEPSTQMTLNTFHLAGHGAENMTLGIPRLKEILMTAPTNIKTPNMTVYFKKGSQMSKEEMESFANQFKKIRFSDIVDEVKVVQSLEEDASGTFSRVYKVTLEFMDHSLLKKHLELKFKDLVQAFRDDFVPLLMNETMKQLKKTTGITDKGKEEIKTTISRATPRKSAATATTKGTKKTSGKNRRSSGDNLEMQLEKEDEMLRKESSHKTKSKKDDDDDDDDEDEEDDNLEIDGVMKKNKEFRGYEQVDDDEKKKKQIVEHKGSEDVISEKESEDDKPEGNITDELKQMFTLKENLMKYHENIKGYQAESNKSVTVTIFFPVEHTKILMLTLAESLLPKIVVKSKKGIEKCVLVTSNKQEDQPYLVVQGINFEAFYVQDEKVDVNRIKSNDIWAIKNKYGIEAARANIVKEVRGVFSMYGIDVDFRHLSLIADFITFNGEYRPFNRIGMEESSSPFLKMSFETTMKYLVGSCLTQDIDDMSTPSSSLVLGQVPKVGTGVFDILQDSMEFD